MRTIYALFTALLCLPALFTSAQECTGTSTAAGEGTFTDGYNYTITTNGDVVSATFQLIEPRDGLVAFAQTYNPDFAEDPMTAVMGESQTFTIDFAGQTAGENFLIACKFAFAGGLSTTTIITYTVGEGCATQDGGGVSLPITFEEDIDYELADFGGNASEIVADPTDASNTVVQTTKAGDAQTWAGTTVADVTGFDQPLPFGADATTMTVRVWSPLANIPVRLKVEQVGVPTISVETEAIVPVAEEWVTLTFDFANEATGTAQINFANTYNKASVFFNFGTPGGDSGEQTYFWDDVVFEGGETPPPSDVIALPITFEEDIDYELADFGGNASEIVADPTDASNTVVQTTKAGDAQTWAGTTVADVTGFDQPIPFEAGATTMTVRVWSPLADIPVRLKVEQVGVPTISVETEAIVPVAEEWVTLTFDFANEATGTAQINFANTYNKASVFFNFGTPGGDSGEQTYFWDDVVFEGGETPPPADAITLPVTFEEDINYELADFGGNASEIVADPTDASNTVVQTTKAGDAQTWAGTTVADVTGFDQPIPFEAGATTMTVRVWSPLADIPVRLKVEQVGVPTISVETEAIVPVAEEWVTLTFDFANEAQGTAMINFANTYNKASVFFNFGTAGADSGEQTYFWDDVTFVGGETPPPADPITLPVTFEEDINYELADFGGNASLIVADPTDASNTVVQTTKAGDAQTWAGTTVADVTGFDEPIPFEEGATTMTVRVWSPLADIPVRLKVEQVGVPTISVETEATVTVAEEWVTLTFDFANEAPGTAMINFANTYNKASVFFNFGTAGADSGEQTYFWDDVTFGSETEPEPVSVYDIISGSPVHTTLTTAIDLAGLDGTLSGDGTFTVFAPTDEAFEAVPAELLTELLDDPTGLLTQVLLYHVLGSTVLSTDITGDVSPETLQGETIAITLDGGNVFVNEAQVTVPDLVADNGVVHVINGVLVPTIISVGEVAVDANRMQVFPNPAVQAVTVIHDFAVSERPIVQVYDFGGKLVYQETTTTEGQVRLDVSMLPAGLYLITVSTNDRIAFDKLMIAR